MAIPKKIHYVWVGGKDKPKDIKRCMKTWQKHLVDYEIIEWNESNFNINDHPFAKKAYEAKKWAYVSDYIRAFVIYNEGGIYFDTDIIMVNKIDALLDNKCFVGYENNEYPFTAVFGAEKGHPLVKDMLDYYNDRDFEFDIKDQYKNVNSKSVADILINNYGCKKGNKEQLLKDGIKVYKEDVLCNPSVNSITIHVFTGTWLEGKSEWKRKINKFLKLRLTNKLNIIIFNFLKKII